MCQHLKFSEYSICSKIANFAIISFFVAFFKIGGPTCQRPHKYEFLSWNKLYCSIYAVFKLIKTKMVKEEICIFVCFLFAVTNLEVAYLERLIQRDITHSGSLRTFSGSLICWNSEFTLSDIIITMLYKCYNGQ